MHCKITDRARTSSSHALHLAKAGRGGTEPPACQLLGEKPLPDAVNGSALERSPPPKRAHTVDTTDESVMTIQNGDGIRAPCCARHFRTCLASLGQHKTELENQGVLLPVGEQIAPARWSFGRCFCPNAGGCQAAAAYTFAGLLVRKLAASGLAFGSTVAPHPLCSAISAPKPLPVSAIGTSISYTV